MKRGKGFTLIEVLTIVILIAIISAIALPRLSVDYRSKRRTQNAVQQILSDIRYTRQLAITDIDATRYIIRFYFNDKTYGIYRNRVRAGNLIGEIKDIPTELTLSGTRAYRFFKLGNANYAGDGVLRLSTTDYTYTISVTKSTGMARMELQ